MAIAFISLDLFYDQYKIYRGQIHSAYNLKTDIFFLTLQNAPFTLIWESFSSVHIDIEI